MDDDLGRALLLHARSAIGEQFSAPPPAIDHHPLLDQPGATFVTLMQGRAVRGCVGTLEAVYPLLADVRKNAQGAAFRDSRFAPLARDELGHTAIEVSLLVASEHLFVH